MGQGCADYDSACHQVTDYPLVKDTLATAHGYVERRPYLNTLYERTLALSLSILHRLEPLQKRLPLELADGYANSALDVVEKYVPQVKMETGELLGMAKQPADAAYGRAADFKSGIQQVSSLTSRGSSRGRNDDLAWELERWVRKLNNVSPCYSIAHLARN